MPKLAKKCIKTWKQKCPQYVIKRWDENNFDIKSHPFLQSAYEAKAWAFVSDYVRLKVVYDYGGIYLDTDVELLRNLDFLRDYGFYIGIQQYQNLCNTGLGFGAERKNDIVQKMLKKYDGMIFSEDEKKKMACPYLNSSVLAELGFSYVDEAKEIKNGIILPSCFMDPIAPGGSKDLLCDKTISLHHYMASWTSKEEQLERRIAIIVGQRQVNSLKRRLSCLVGKRR